MKYSHRLILLFILLSNSIHAQILNIEKSRLDRDTSDFVDLNLSLDFSLFNRSAAVTEPVNLLGFNHDLNFIWKKKKHALIFISQINYLRINEDPFLNTGFTHLRGHLWKVSRWSMELYTQYSYDNFRRLNPRIVSGSNARYEILKNDKFTLYTGFGLMWENERWEHPFTDEVVRVHFLKTNKYLSFRMKINEVVDFNTVTYYQLGYDQSINDFRHRINHFSNVMVKVSKRLSLRMSFNIQYEDKPIIPITPLIYSITNGLVFTF